MFNLKYFVFVLCFLFSAFASATTIDVLVIYDKTTISTVDDLDTSGKRLAYSGVIIGRLQDTFDKSNIDVTFSLKKQGLWPIYNGDKSKRSLVNMRADYLDHLDEINLTYGAMFLQKSYKADVVFVLYDSNDPSNGTCGIAMGIPNKSLLSDYSSISSLMQEPRLGIIFINAGNPECLEDEQLYSHEFGHTLGIFHMPKETNSDGTIVNNTSEMLVDGAAGYRAKNTGSIGYFTTVMVPSKISSAKRHNRFSDKSATWECGTFHTFDCGDDEASAVDIINTYLNDYAKRGDSY